MRITNYNVAWQVQEQGNIDHYDILLSKDGTDFKSIGTVKSKALEGDNSSLLDYTFHIDFGAATKTLGYTGFIGLLSFGFSRKRKWAMLFPVIALFTIIACNRDKDITDKNKPYFLQIRQVKKDNTTLYSFVVKVNNKKEQ